jgi:protein PsiE
MTMRPNEVQNLGAKLRKSIDPIGTVLADGFHFLGLFAIGAATVWAAAQAFLEMMKKGHASVEDLLLLFIYLEIGSMVGVYFKTNSMPLRFVIYVSITAVTRHLIGFVNQTSQPDVGVLILAGGILMLSLAVLVIRYASFHYGASAGLAAAATQQLTDSEHEAKQKAAASSA